MNKREQTDNNEHSEAKLRFVGVAFLIITSLSVGFIGGYLGSQGSFSGDSNTAREQQAIEDESNLITEIAKDVGPSVVSVNVTSESIENDIFGPRSSVRQSAGTGFILSEEGIIITNRHVVPDNTSDISIVLSDGTELNNVEVLGRTSPNDPLDVAFIKVNDNEGNDLKPIELGNSSEVEVGDRVVAIGNALGQFENTVTSGIISGYGRSVDARGGSGNEALQNLFQTDAAINQGNSGGPLVNFDGQVIGINTAIAGGSAQNIGFAIPIDDVKGLIKSVLETGELKRPYLGVLYVPITDDYAYEYNLPVERGAYIPPGQGGRNSIIPGSPADNAGLQEKDIITKVDGEDINQENSLASVLGQKTVGDTVELTVLRGGEEQTIDVTLGDMLEE